MILAMMQPSLTTTRCAEVEAAGRIAAMPRILEIACHVAGMRFAAVAHVTPAGWTACAVRDALGTGVRPGTRLEPEAMLCGMVSRDLRPRLVENLDAAGTRAALGGLRLGSCVSVPIVLADGSVFGTLCAADPEACEVEPRRILSAFELFTALIASQLDAELRAAASDAVLAQERETSRLREEFIAVLGHDLRSPLQSVSAGTRMLLRRPERAEEIAGHIERSIARMAGLIDNVMDFARGRLGGGLELNRSADVPLAPMLLQVVEEMRSTHPDRLIELALAIDEPVHCDHARIAQILSNLLGNALTHGADGQPVQVSADTKAGVFTLFVANAGEPIPPATLDGLFHPFFRGAPGNGQGGLGLGLYIASEIARAHGGVLDVTSTPAVTCFTFRMPLVEGQGSALDPAGGSAPLHPLPGGSASWTSAGD